MIGGLLLVLTCQLGGEIVTRLTGLPLPGPVVGMLLFLLVLRTRHVPSGSTLMRGPRVLLRHLQLLFVPAGVGIIVYLGELRRSWLPVAGGLWVSWTAGLAVTGLVASLLLRRKRARR